MQSRVRSTPAPARDVANAALFLAADEANFITGVALPVVPVGYALLEIRYRNACIRHNRAADRIPENAAFLGMDDDRRGGIAAPALQLRAQAFVEATRPARHRNKRG
jgi:hypothetical protein